MHDGETGASGGGERIARLDEMLELLYWLEGEGFTSTATLDRIARFVARPEEQVRETLAQLVERGDVALTLDEEAGPAYRLTSVGRREAGRRFAETFGPMLGRGHGECSDPNCDCHTDPAAAADCLATRSHGGHDH